ncbi:MYG1 family protein [Rhodovastum atsumiense]|uniref:MYG1 family protein n=2 Tax=Rhodovastum atsumiense TaxID=504468 RepID=A0A5M6J290_9PROT|nr:MYG1 family protein [Rhodovastum atsumiense]
MTPAHDTTTAPRPLLATHSGSFHLDDAFAYVVLCLARGLHEPGRDHTLVRTRDEATIAGADVVWDVGAVYDPAASRFDHHQRGAPVREDHTPFSAAGLVWRHHGEQAVQTLLDQDGTGGPAAAIAAVIDQEVVRRIDAIDNGVGEPGDALNLSAIVEDHNPAWDSPAVGDRTAEDAAFLRAAGLVDGFLRRRVAMVRARLAAEAVVATAHARSADPRLLELDRKLPWEGPVFTQGLPVLYALYPVPNGNWMVDAMPPEPGSFAQRLPLPAAWAGLRDADLAAASGVADAVFVHPRRFVGAARSREGALALARKAIALADQPAG